ncbi:hypothetical protein PVL29_004262 [Vitis rotundifolia]|uniref:Sulfate transporter n=1 Tax=Vitis rotundifolia TaxID=103349 RepID=A0AA39E292_VITRO|nr:hypothetical protein PVL29_004262 [Vitis rotundifolia]
MEVVYRLIPLPVVRGVQLSQGLSFAMTTVKYIRKEQDFFKSKSSGERYWVGLDGLLLALVCAGFIVVVNGAGEESRGGGGKAWGRRTLRRVISFLPSAAIVFLLGVVLAIVRRPHVMKEMKVGPSPIKVVNISKHAWKEGFIKGAIPQLPLSLLNSVIAVCKLSSNLFLGKNCTVTSVSVTVGLMNLVGLYKFGGRSGGCVALLGAAKLVLGLVLGCSLAKLLNQFPVGVLGVLLLFAGIELAMAFRDMASKEESFVMILYAAVSLVGSSAAIGFLCGIIVHLLLGLRNMSKDQSCSIAFGD